mmetsp:Transcript_9009/g.13779  ORF Transcript_9009/g.13779 Transcript_9009/m.13779 type:complete len:166 (-) Transcript_9009:164-661(-)
MNSDTVLTLDFLFPAWNLSKRKPTFFANCLKKIYPKTEIDVTFDDMTYVSASNPTYFDAAKVKFTNTDGEKETNQFIGGGVISENPAMYAQLMMMERYGVPVEKISVTSVGGEQYESNKISSEVSPLQWMSRVFTLLAPVKKYTQNYMAEHILRQHARSWRNFIL